VIERGSIPAQKVLQMDPATTQALAKAAGESAKTTGKALEIVHDTGGYLNRVFGDLVVNGVGWLIGDWVGEKRKRNFDALCRRTLEILHERKVQGAIELSPNQATELLMGAQDESRLELAELWARLLANAMDPGLNNVRHSFIASVREMDPMDARTMNYLYSEKVTGIRIGGGGNKSDTSIEYTAEQLGARQDDIEVSVRHLEILGVSWTPKMRQVARWSPAPRKRG
jgi:Abortive infection alpha